MQGTTAIKRSGYAITGQVLAFRVVSTPAGANDGLFYVFTDHLGSTSLLRKSGTTIPFVGSTTRYLPFGGYRTPPTQTLTDRDFTGQKENRELGLVYYNARFYVPAIGRFLSADTLVPNPANPQSLNRYSYTYNNPLSYVDPSGHCSVSTYLTGTVEDCWYDETEGKVGNWFIVDDRYVFDQNHVKSAFKRGEQLIEDIREAVKSGGGDVPVARPKGIGVYTGTWTVSGNISESEIVGVAYAIYQEFELGYEASYQAGQGLDQFVSSYGIEDLPSDHLGFWAASQGLAEDELFSVLEGLGEVTTRFLPPVALGHGIDAAGNESYGIVKNHSFAPMSIDFAPFEFTLSGFPWPSEFQIQPLNSRGLYVSKSLGFVPD